LKSLQTSLFILIIAVAFNGNAQFQDNFTDGDFTSNPTWSGDALNYEVDGSNQLHLNHLPAVTDESYLSTPSSAINNAEWEFYVELDFNPSSSNLAKVYLVSDQQNLEGSLNGYFVEVGNSNDEVSLFKQTGATTTKIIDGIDDLINMSLVHVSVKVTRDSLGNWELLADSSGANNYLSQGTILDNTYTQSAYFGVRSIYTSTRSDKFWYDNFNVIGTAFQDTVKPTLLSINVINQNDIQLTFSENMETLSAETPSNYLVDNGLGNPSSAVVEATDSAKVNLNFSTAFPLNTNLNLEITNVEDRSSNVIDTVNQSFGFWQYDTASFGDVLINEIFADPSPTVGLPSEEYLELLNNTSKTFDLSSWTLVNSSNGMTVNGSTFNSGAYLIVCDQNDVGLFSSFGDVIGISSFSALSNGGDSLTLIDEFGTIIDIVTYDDAWYADPIKADGGYSLERINPNHPCSGESNWVASNASNGGTPGAQNSVFSTVPDNTSPIISEATVININLIDLQFSKGIDTAALATFSFSIDNGITISSIDVIGIDRLHLNISSLDSSTIYTLTYDNVLDCFSNSSGNQNVTFGIGTNPEEFDLVITELFPDPDEELSNLPEAEFVEIFNRSNKLIKLDELELTDGTTISGLSLKTIFPGEYLILCDDGNTSSYDNYGSALGLSSMPSLNNSGDLITLRLNNGTVIHEVQYEDDWYQNEIKSDGGWTLEMIDPDNPCGRISNWAASEDTDGGTPGQKNSIDDDNSDELGPQIDWGAASNDTTILVYFNERINGEQWGELTNYNFSDGLTPKEVTVSKESVSIEVNPLLQKGKLYNLRIGESKDCVGNNSANLTIQFPLPEKGLEGDLIINEVLFNPRSSGTDFVEVYNNSDKYIGLENWAFANYQGDSISSIKLISSLPYVIFPREYILFSEDSKNVLEEYPLSNEAALVEVDDLPTYSNDEGSVILLDKDEDVIDRFDYTDNLQFVLLDIDDGVSLERISFDLPTNDKNNWHSAAESVGFATPGYKNSQFLETNTSTDEVIVNPEIFSPDNDGYQDVVSFEYTFDQPGYVASVNIYDSRGRLEKIIAQNQLLGTNGAFLWDGINEKREKSRIGLYVLFFEVFDLDGNMEQYKRTVVLGGKLN
jgi:hypothetical protein